MGKINLRKAEYSQFQKDLASYHQTEEKNIRLAIKEIREILKNGNAFKMDNTTKNLVSLLDILENEMLPLVVEVFKDTEDNVSTIVTSFNNIDTLC